MSDDTWETIGLANLARHGHKWPVGGGSLDESKWFTDAARFVWSEMDRTNSPATE